MTDDDATAGKKTASIPALELANPQEVTFSITDENENATSFGMDGESDVRLTLLDAENKSMAYLRKAETDAFTLPAGTYSYKLQKSGCSTLSGNIAVNGADQTVSLKLEALPTWDGTAEQEPMLGKTSDGTADAYLVGYPHELAWIRNRVNDDEGTSNTELATYNVRLLQDIDLNNYAWEPIGKNKSSYTYSVYPYKGIFDGSGHKISNLNAKHISPDGREPYVALFGYVQNATLENLIVSGTSNPDSIQNAYPYVAGIAARAIGSVMRNCGNEANVSYASISENVAYIGGVTAACDAGTGTITECYNKGQVSLTGTQGSFNTNNNGIGGIIGYIHATEVNISNCYNLGTITATKNAGGIVGNSYYGCAMENCYAAGAIQGSSQIGVLVGNYTTSPTFNNCRFYGPNDSDTKYAHGANNTTPNNVTKASGASEITKENMGNAYQEGVSSFNDGFPSLAWEHVPGTTLVTFTFDSIPDGATMTLTSGSTEIACTQSGTSFTVDVTESLWGTFQYKATASDYRTITGSIEVGSEDVIKELGSFERLKRKVTFAITCDGAAVDGAAVVVKDSSGSVVAAEQDGSWLLPSGTYTYTVTAENYRDSTDMLTVETKSEEESDLAGISVPVMLKFIPENERPASQADKNALTAAANAAEAEKSELTDASEAALSKLEAAITAAKQVATDKNSTNGDVAAASSALQSALEAARAEQAAANNNGGGGGSSSSSSSSSPDNNGNGSGDNGNGNGSGTGEGDSTPDASDDATDATDDTDDTDDDAGYAIGVTFTISNKNGTWTYRMTAENEVSLTKASKTKKDGKVTINTASYNGTKFRVTAIGANALKGSLLKKVTYGKNVKTIGASAFPKNKRLTSLTVGAGVCKIGAKAFQGCKKLKKIVVKSKQLTKKAYVKNALKGSSIQQVKLSGVKGKAKKQVKKAFMQAGRKKVSVK